MLNQAESVELHGFGDSSIQAYDSCVYVRADYGSKVYVHLMSSETRVAPLLTTRLITSVRFALENFITINSVNYWLEPSIGLHWVTNNENEYKPYIENRRQEIRKLVDPISFNYCPTKENPADHTTRGLPLPKLAKNTIWLYGPKFLELPPDQHPKLKGELSTEEIFHGSQELK